MAKNSYLTDDKLRKQKADDAVPYKVMIALALMSAALFGLNALKDFYTTVEGINLLLDRAYLIGLAGLAVLAVSVVLLVVLRKFRICRMVLPWLAAIGTLIALTGGAMTVSWIEDFDLLTFICVAAVVQYIVFQLYKWEFFLVSMPTVASAVVFFGLKGSFYPDARCVFLVTVALVLIAGSALIAWRASANKGLLRIGGKTVKIFSAKLGTVPVYLLCALWLVCIAAVVVLSFAGSRGGLFSYYCMFAAIAVEFIAAVYYTFQLN